MVLKLTYCLFLLTALLSNQICHANEKTSSQNVILLVLDGFASSFLNYSLELEGLKRMEDFGVRAEYLKPAFPSITFPNLHTIATGLNPENHGMSGNFLFDERSNMQFGMGSGPNDTHQLWWNRTDPIWYTASKNNIIVHCYWWPGCRVPHKDIVVQVPTERVYNVTHDQSHAINDQFDEMVTKIKRYQRYRRQLFLEFYAPLDETTHVKGVRSQEARDEIAKADSLVAELQDKLEAADLFETTNLIILSDHGAMDMSKDQRFYIEDCLSDQTLIELVIDNHHWMQVYPKEGKLEKVFKELERCELWDDGLDFFDNEDDGDSAKVVQVYRREHLPAKFNLKNAPFLAPIILLSKPGVSIITESLPVLPPAEYSTNDYLAGHGWDNDLPEMRSIFFARGPAFKQKYKSSPLDMVDVYQILLSLLDIKPVHGHNGTWANVEAMFVDDRPAILLDSPDPANVNIMSTTLLIICVIISLLCVNYSRAADYLDERNHYLREDW